MSFQILLLFFTPYDAQTSSAGSGLILSATRNSEKGSFLWQWDASKKFIFVQGAYILILQAACEKFQIKYIVRILISISGLQAGIT